MKRERFTKEEAEKKVGAIIKTRVEFASVPKGTQGKVVKIDDMGGGEWDVVIRWMGEYFEKYPLEDWFTKDEYERYMEEL
jgi:hypothetical protein